MIEGVGEFIAANIMNMLTPIGVFGAWFFGRKRGRADTKVVEGNALVGMQNAYSKFVDDAAKEYASLKEDSEKKQAALEQESVKKYEDLEKESIKRYESLHDEFEKFKKEIKEIISKKDEISAGRERRIKELEGQIRDLKKAS
jgi:hypothetical protein